MRLHSMTAYGYGETQHAGSTYLCEIRTLNSRFLEVNVRLPRHVLGLEPQIINHIKGQLKRGKVDVFIDIVNDQGGRELPRLDRAAVEHYAKLFDELQSTLERSIVASFATLQDPNPSDFFRFDGVLVTDGKNGRGRGPASAEEHEPHVFAAVDAALSGVKTSRAKEGEALGQAMVDLVGAMMAERQHVEAKRDGIMQHLQKTYIKRLENAVASLQKIAGGQAGEIPPERLLAEVAILSDKVDIDEELTRLGTHGEEFLRLLKTEDGIGRKLDFICQEMHREVNTMSNKLVQTDVAQHMLEMKQLVERLRQQVQNIE